MTKGSETPTRRKSGTFSTTQQSPAGPASRGRIYRTISAAGEVSWVTRDIAALDFLLGIPMEAEPSIVQAGWMQQQDVAEENLPMAGQWWEKLVSDKASNEGMLQEGELEKPNTKKAGIVPTTTAQAPGRRLDGDDSAIRIQIPLELELKTRQRSIARQAAIREWELQVAKPLLDGRIYMSAKGGYPMELFSVVRYEPRREEAKRRRQKLEEKGGGGSDFVIPERDWRGTTYKALLPRVEKTNGTFNRLLRDDEEEQNSDSELSSASDESDAYVPGFLDDPEMVQGRHRHVMIGDRVTGCIVSSTIQFVKPEDLKADLNKQFRERFDGWEPPKSQWKYIGAKVIDGVYTLLDPTEDHDDRSREEGERRLPRKGSMSSTSTPVEAKDTLRMPPSLTLSKIRAAKQQALMAATHANLEVSTVALACVYFERLCLDTRVDKSNRRLSFAACLLLAAKINESTLSMFQQHDDNNDDEDKKARIQSWIRPTNQSRSMFASLLEFFAHDWSLSLKHLFAAEWGVFAALGFKLHASPSQVAFHFRRLMKVLEWSPLLYLGPEMHSQWIKSLNDEDHRRGEHEKRKQLRRERKEQKLLELQHELQLQQETDKNLEEADKLEHVEVSDVATPSDASKASMTGRKSGAMNFLHRFGMKRPPSMDKLSDHARLSMKRPPSMDKLSDHGRFSMKRPPSMEKLADQLPSSDHVTSRVTRQKQFTRSPSLPVIAGGRQSKSAHVAIDINEADDSETCSIEAAFSEGGIMF